MSEQYHHNALPPGSMVDEYHLLEVLGEGGFGIVYQGEGRYLKDQVAIKEYLPRHLATRTDGLTVAPTSPDSQEAYAWGLDKFQEEARILWKLAQPERHPNIVAVRRFLEANGTTYMVMDYEEAQPLSSIIKSNAVLTQTQIEELLFRLLDGLERVHKAGVWHRDIKPANILIRADGSPVLIDFGAARQALDSHTRSVVAAITPPYAAFEQYAAQGNDGPWTDIYALGVTVYRCITGKLPPSATERIESDGFTPLSEQNLRGYTPSFLSAIDRALEVWAKDRPQSVNEWLCLFDDSDKPVPQSLEEDEVTTVLRTSKRADNQTVSKDLNETQDTPIAKATVRKWKTFLLGFSVIVGVFVATLIYQDSLLSDKDAKAWQRALQISDAESITRYLRAYPDGAHIREAQALLAQIERDAAAARQEKELARLEEKRRIEELRRAEEQAKLDEEAALSAADKEAWLLAQERDSEISYTDYLSAYPRGDFVAEASARRATLQRERGAWEEALRVDSENSYRNYLSAFAAGVYRSDAEDRLAALKEQRDAEAQAKAEALLQEQLAEAERQREQTSIDTAEELDSVEGYLDYLEVFPSGSFASQAQLRIRQILAEQSEIKKNLEEMDEILYAQKRSNVRSGPDTSAKKIGLLSIGREVEVTGKVGDWYRIRLEDNKQGYVFGALLGQSNPNAIEMVDVEPVIEAEPEFIAQPAAVPKPSLPAAGSSFKDCPLCPEMVVLPPGTFMMGSYFGEGNDTEKPVHKVTIAKAFAVAKYEITQAEWKAIMATNPSGFRNDRNPVEWVNWFDAKKFVKQLSEKTGKPYRLLSEAEWEYAARAGNRAPYISTGAFDTKLANFDGRSHSRTGSNGLYLGKTSRVGSYPANAFGLHDMQGNVWEWVEDCWHKNYDGAPNNGSAWLEKSCRKRVLRGGAWSNNLEKLRPANRFKYDSANRFTTFGFRVARDL